MKKITYENKNKLYENSLLDKLGFSYEQLVGRYNNEQLIFNSSSYNTSLLEGQSNLIKYNSQTKPVTTNGLIGTNLIPSLSSNSRGLPMFQTLAVIKPGITVSIAQEPDFIEAINTHKKYNYSHLVVRSNIIDNKYFIGGSTISNLPAIAYVTKSFTSGNFIYSTQQSLQYTADRDYIVSNVTTEITAPDGTPAQIGSNSSVIYKIIKTKNILNLNEEEFYVKI